MKHTLIVLALLLPGLAGATDGTGKSRSIGKSIKDESFQLLDKITDLPTVTAEPAVTEPFDSNNLQGRLAAHGTPVSFEIFDAWVELSGDLDEDGFYHHIKVSFDADVNTELETVYAKLYLSREGHTWYQYFTTDLFEIQGDAADDSYEVLTELVEGYPSGYYDVLVELHSLYHPGVVASRIINRDVFGDSISLEDIAHDSVYDYHSSYEETYVYGSSGSLSITGMIGLLLLLGVKRSRATQIK